MFTGDTCQLCWRSIPTGTGKAEHARKHVREGRSTRVGLGTKETPFRYIILTGESIDYSI